MLVGIGMPAPLLVVVAEAGEDFSSAEAYCLMAWVRSGSSLVSHGAWRRRARSMVPAPTVPQEAHGLQCELKKCISAAFHASSGLPSLAVTGGSVLSTGGDAKVSVGGVGVRSPQIPQSIPAGMRTNALAAPRRAVQEGPRLTVVPCPD